MAANIFNSLGKYCLFIRQVFRKPESRKMIRKQILIETDRLIMSSIVIVGVISLFMGGVLVIQTASNMSNPVLDKMLIGYMVRESMILEFSSTMVALILAGKMGSSIASEIGSMRITQQLDAIDMMGINSASYCRHCYKPPSLPAQLRPGTRGRRADHMDDGHHPDGQIHDRHKIRIYRILHCVQLHQDLGLLLHYLIGCRLSRILRERRLARSGQIQHQGDRRIQHPDTDVRPDNDAVNVVLNPNPGKP